MSGIIQVLVVILIIVLLFIAGISLGFVIFITKPKRTDMEKSVAIEKSKNFWGNYDNYEKEEWNIKNGHGYLLHGVWIKNEGKKFVIITHGYTYTRNGSIKYANIFHDLGYNVYIYDLRHHGENKDCYCSMGKYESDDVLAVAEAIRKRFGEDCEIGLHGESLGCSSSILALGKDQRFSFLVADCGFSDLRGLMVYQAHERFHLPVFLAYTASIMNKICHGYSFFSVRPKDALQNNQVPVLFIHGAEDTFIPPEMCREMYDLTSSKKEIHFFDGAGHAGSYESNPKQYRTIVKNFLLSLEQKTE